MPNVHSRTVLANRPLVRDDGMTIGEARHHRDLPTEMCPFHTIDSASADSLRTADLVSLSGFGFVIVRQWMRFLWSFSTLRLGLVCTGLHDDIYSTEKHKPGKVREHDAKYENSIC